MSAQDPRGPKEHEKTGTEADRALSRFFPRSAAEDAGGEGLVRQTPGLGLGGDRGNAARPLAGGGDELTFDRRGKNRADVVDAASRIVERHACLVGEVGAAEVGQDRLE